MQLDQDDTQRSKSKYNSDVKTSCFFFLFFFYSFFCVFNNVTTCRVRFEIAERSPSRVTLLERAVHVYDGRTISISILFQFDNFVSAHFFCTLLRGCFTGMRTRAEIHQMRNKNESKMLLFEKSTALQRGYW